jgi:transcriptional regulator with XRE-family HTH domain
MSIPSQPATLAGMTLEEIGTLIRKHREKKGISIREMASQMGLDDRNTKPVMNLEKGLNITFETLAAACAAVDLEIIVRPIRNVTKS